MHAGVCAKSSAMVDRLGNFLVKLVPEVLPGGVKTILFAGATALALPSLYHTFRPWLQWRQLKLARIAKQKREARDAAMAEHRLCTPRDTIDEIFPWEDGSASALLERLPSGSINSGRLLHCFMHRAACVDKAINRVTAESFEAALSAAKKADRERGSAGVADQGLAGLPTSMKDHFEQEGTDCICGMASRLN